MKAIASILSVLFYLSMQAQQVLTRFSTPDYSLNNSYFTSYSLPAAPVKLHQRNYGIIIGVERGRNTSIELGGEAHWRKLSLKNARIVGATANMEYNFGHHIIGYKAGMWMKQGRINLTYGGNLVYFNDFNGRCRYGIGPAVGFRLLGLHFINGFNFLAGDKELNKVNTLYISLRYYFPLDNKFTWDRKNKDKEKRQRAKEKEKRKRQREKGKGKKDKPKLFPF
ncbi:MAG: hypothetical protein M3342_02040 [Bacteroidota bacterium]|nr:hypothetical protein [Flavisolibacter sp.]MBD0367116.1 hypothetical protein [Flavisolibacter sp.]MBD0376285.1 hypothetical protein [Flavisolibacter sp.]MDQ3842783.1 hypothetical protein [Bacteroidota bacterium]